MAATTVSLASASCAHGGTGAQGNSISRKEDVLQRSSVILLPPIGARGRADGLVEASAAGSIDASDQDASVQAIAAVGSSQGGGVADAASCEVAFTQRWPVVFGECVRRNSTGATYTLTPPEGIDRVCLPGRILVALADPPIPLVANLIVEGRPAKRGGHRVVELYFLELLPDHPFPYDPPPKGALLGVIQFSGGWMESLRFGPGMPSRCDGQEAARWQ